MLFSLNMTLMLSVKITSVRPKLTVYQV